MQANENKSTPFKTKRQHNETPVKMAFNMELFIFKASDLWYIYNKENEHIIKGGYNWI